MCVCVRESERLPKSDIFSKLFSSWFKLLHFEMKALFMQNMNYFSD